MRLRSLDALRGVAALVVVFHHLINMVPGLNEDRTTSLRHGIHSFSDVIYLTPLRLLVSGPAMVLLFFILSGLVLGLTFVNRDKMHYGPFVIKRFTRIWLPFAAVICISFGLQLVCPNKPVAGASQFLEQWSWADPATISILIQHLTMTGTVTTLDIPMWSLIVEMQASIIFPLLVALTLWNKWLALLSTMLLSICAAFIMSRHLATGFPLTCVNTCCFLFLFVLGIMFATQLAGWRHALERQGKSVTRGLWLVAFAAICLSPESTASVYSLSQELLLFVSAFGCAIVVFLCLIQGRALSYLLSPPIQWLGKISYSIYLTHFVVIAVVLRLLNGVVPFSVSLAISAALTLPVAWLSWKWLEMPTMAAGRAVTKRLFSRSLSSKQETT